MTAIKSPYDGLVKRPRDVIGPTGSEVNHKESALLSSSPDRQISLPFNIYNNNLDMYTDSRVKYLEFIDKYPQDELIPSVEYELEQIDQILKQINNN